MKEKIEEENDPISKDSKEAEEPAPENAETQKTAIFAGGCFWCMEAAFEEKEGVLEALSGYTGGEKENPSYEEVGTGTTGHREAVRVKYDPEKTSYEELLDVYWKHIDPFDDQGQFADKGPQYTTAIFYLDEEQKRLAEESKKQVEKKLGKEVATEILSAKEFYRAEENHQDYHKKNKIRFQLYKKASGRQSRLKEVWGHISSQEEEDIKKILTPLQYKVTQEEGTEPAFQNEYWNNTQEGIYVDVVSGEVLFSSKDKFKSGTGWPSFTRPLEEENIVEKKELMGLGRTEVRSKNADSHLGHVFKDGPEPTGLRYCINSAALKFIPKEKLEEEGYGNYKGLFD